MYIVYRNSSHVVLEYVYDAILEEIFMSVWLLLSFEEEEGEVMRCRGDCLAALSCKVSLRRLRSAKRKNRGFVNKLK